MGARGVTKAKRFFFQNFFLNQNVFLKLDFNKFHGQRRALQLVLYVLQVLRCTSASIICSTSSEVHL